MGRIILGTWERRLVRGLVGIAWMWVGLGIGGSPRLRAAAPPRPNILYLLADDMGVGDVSALNPRCAWRTPNIDQLAREGRTFTDAHSSAGVCTPSRYTLLTGRYSWRGALKSSVLHGYDPALIEPGRVTVASFLRDHGYVTAMVGKWHLGLDWARAGTLPEQVDFSRPFAGGPTAHGFGRFLGIAASLDMPPYVYLDGDRPTVVPTRRVDASPLPGMWRAGPIGDDFRHAEVQSRFVGRALDFLAERAAARDAKPFFLYLAFASPHTPILPTGDFVGRTRTNPYGDFVTQLDADIGTLLRALSIQGLATNTLVIFTADNGCAPYVNLAELRRVNHDPSAGFRGYKSDLFEGGHRVPFIARWPGQVPAGTRCTRTIGQVDLLATCAELVGATLPPGAGEDSVSLVASLRRGDRATGGRESLVHQSMNGSLALREGRWKLLMTPDSGGWSVPHPGTAETNGLPRRQLYDLESDPAETRNLEARHPAVARRMTRTLKEIVQRGRSTPGPRLTNNTSVPWPQVGWMEDPER